MSATVRFLKVVEAAGKPQAHTLWGGLDSDAEFQRAVKARRVMTIRQANVGTKKDFGLVGFSQEGPAQFLVFPRSLKPFEGRRVIGINYDLFAPAPAPGAAWKMKPVKAEKEKKPRSSPETRRPEPPAVPEAQEPEGPPVAKSEAAERVPRSSAPAEPSNEKRLHQVETPASPRPAAKKKMDPGWDRGAILKELKSAMKELEAGKAVLVFRRLEKVVNGLAESG